MDLPNFFPSTITGRVYVSKTRDARNNLLCFRLNVVKYISEPNPQCMADYEKTVLNLVQMVDATLQAIADAEWTACRRDEIIRFEKQFTNSIAVLG